MECNNEAKLKEQNRSRLTDSKKVTKGKELGRVLAEGGRRVLKGTMINSHNIGGHREGSVAQRIQVMTL